MLEQVLVPYYTRTPEDIRAAMDLAAGIPMGNDDGYPGSLLSLVDILAYPVTLGQGPENFQRGFEMFWSIHQGAVRGADATMDELEAIRSETRRLWAEVYDSRDGIVVTYLACVIRRGT